MSITKSFVFAILVCAISSMSKANLDVYFSDSAQYQVHLIHEHDDINVWFRVNNAGINIEVPTLKYNFLELEKFANDAYQYENPAIKPEFVVMFNKSFISKLPLSLAIPQIEYDFGKDTSGKATFRQYDDKFEEIPDPPFISQFPHDALLNELSRLLQHFAKDYPAYVH